MPTSVDKEVGKAIRKNKEFLDGAKIDEVKSKQLNDFYRELGFDNETEVYVVHSRDFNAFALPDNSIFVLSQVLEDLKTYPQLAALLGHEYSHIKHRHSMKMLGQALSWELLASAFSGNSSDDFIHNANTLLSLHNSRAFETQADQGGLGLLEQRNIDMKGMVELFEIMENINNGKETPTYLSTHPDTKDRLDVIKLLLKEKKNNFQQNNRLDEIFKKLKSNLK